MTISLAAIEAADDTLIKRGPLGYPCCTCCPGDPRFHEDNPPDSHEVPCESHRPTVEQARALAAALRAVLALLEPRLVADALHPDAPPQKVQRVHIRAADIRKAIEDAGVTE